MCLNSQKSSDPYGQLHEGAITNNDLAREGCWLDWKKASTFVLLQAETMRDEALSIENVFVDLKSPRRRTPAHDLGLMLIVAVCAILSGADSWVAPGRGAQKNLTGFAVMFRWSTALPLTTPSGGCLRHLILSSSKHVLSDG